MWFFSDVGNVPTLNVRSGIWDRVESYAMHMVLTRRLKIIPTSNLKLIISSLVLLILVLSLFKLLSVVCLEAVRSLNLAYCLGVGQQA